MRLRRDDRHRDVGRFDQWAETYDRHYLQHVLFERMHKLVVDAARRYRRDATALLDVGCGTGRLLARVRDVFPNARLAGVDAAAGMIDAARRVPGADSITFLVGDVESLPFDDESFDVVMTTLSFHHWRDQRAGLLEIQRVLRPRGVLLLGDLVLQWWMRPFAVVARARHRTHTSTEFQQMLAAAGFTLMARIPLPGVLHAVQLMVAQPEYRYRAAA
jgi:ubiquinone/menaquinone biosynthesis C-methylase UbiE